MDLHTLITWLLTLAVVIVLLVRGRSKRSDRRRDEVERRQRSDSGDRRSLY